MRLPNTPLSNSQDWEKLFKIPKWCSPGKSYKIRPMGPYFSPRCWYLAMLSTRSKSRFHSFGCSVSLHQVLYLVLWQGHLLQGRLCQWNLFYFTFLVVFRHLLSRVKVCCNERLIKCGLHSYTLTCQTKLLSVWMLSLTLSLNIPLQVMITETQWSVF